MVAIPIRIVGPISIRLLPPLVYVMSTAVGPAGGPVPRAKEPIMGAPLTIRDDQKFDITVADVKDDVGDVVGLDGPPSWTSSDPAVAGVTASPDGLIGTVAGAGPGTATVTVTVQAGGATLTDSWDVTVTTAPGVVIDTVVGDPVSRLEPLS